MIKGNIITASRWSSDLTLIDTTNEVVSKTKNDNIDFYYFIAESNCTFVQEGSMIKVKAGQIVFHKGYENTVLVFNPKDSIATVLAAFKAREVELEAVRKEENGTCVSSN